MMLGDTQHTFTLADQATVAAATPIDNHRISG